MNEESIYRCLKCGTSLSINFKQNCVCKNCGEEYLVKHDIVVFVKKSN